MPNAQKIEKVAALKERIQSSEGLLLAEYRGLSVHDATELRRSLSDHARFAIVKNTLFERAAADAGVAELRELLDGPTAVAFVQDDVVATAKKVVDAAKKFPALVIKGGFLDGKILSAAEAQALAALDSREVMLSKIAGMLKSEMSRAASMFQTLQGRFAGLLEAYKEKLPGAEEPAEAPEEPAAEASEEPAAEAQEPATEAADEPAAESTDEPAADTEAGSAEEASIDEPESEQLNEPKSEEG
ncbi:MAG TPA: 50S ribosomal protein L10 [Actinomycetota bacterium]|nr:50S ribosomal protein L10 [Actinomycetota bacterium]